MTHSKPKTMKEVVAQLREDAAEALLEVFELHIAVGELAQNAQILSAVIAEFAAEAAKLADAPEFASGEHLRELAKAAAKTSDVVNGQATALAQIQHGLDAWDITQPGLRLV